MTKTNEVTAPAIPVEAKIKYRALLEGSVGRVIVMEILTKGAKGKDGARVQRQVRFLGVKTPGGTAVTTLPHPKETAGYRFEFEAVPGGEALLGLVDVAKSGSGTALLNERGERLSFTAASVKATAVKAEPVAEQPKQIEPVQEPAVATTENAAPVDDESMTDLLQKMAGLVDEMVTEQAPVKIEPEAVPVQIEAQPEPVAEQVESKTESKTARRARLLAEKQAAEAAAKQAEQVAEPVAEQAPIEA